MIPSSRRLLLLRRIAIAVVVLSFIVFVAWGLVQAAKPAPQQIQGMVDTDQLSAASRGTGRVAQLLVAPGDTVQRGQLLATLANPEVEARQAETLAGLSSAEAMQQRTDSGAREQDLASLEATWRSAQANADLAAITAQRMENLYAEKAIPQQRRDNAVATRQATAEAAQAARQQYLKAMEGARDEDKAIAAGHTAAAAARSKRAQALGDELQVLAPLDGVVDKQFAHEGEIVLPGVPVFTLINPSDLWVSFSVREDQYPGMALGRELRGSIPALALDDVAFRVSHIAAQGDFATWRSTRQSSGYDVRSFEVRARPVAAHQDLRPGMSVLFAWPQE